MVIFYYGHPPLRLSYIEFVIPSFHSRSGTFTYVQTQVVCSCDYSSINCMIIWLILKVIKEEFANTTK